MKRHRERCHMLGGGKLAYLCAICDSSFTEIQDMQNHRATAHMPDPSSGFERRLSAFQANNVVWRRIHGGDECNSVTAVFVADSRSMADIVQKELFRLSNARFCICVMATYIMVDPEDNAIKDSISIALRPRPKFLTDARDTAEITRFIRAQRTDIVLRAEDIGLTGSGWGKHKTTEYKSNLYYY